MFRAYPKEVERYGSYKELLAIRYDDTRFYSKAKKPFVMNWYKKNQYRSDAVGGWWAP